MRYKEIKNIKDLKSKEEVLDFVQDYLKNNIMLSQRKMESEDSFDKVAWGEYQAFQLGNIKALKKLQNILTGRKVIE